MHTKTEKIALECKTNTLFAHKFGLPFGQGYSLVSIYPTFCVVDYKLQSKIYQKNLSLYMGRMYVRDCTHVGGGGD